MDKDALAVEAIRARNTKLLASGAVGGVREWFDISFLLRYIDKLKTPEVVTTYEELDALPSESLVITEQGGYWMAKKQDTGRNIWLEPGNKYFALSIDLTLPAEVLARGE